MSDIVVIRDTTVLCHFLVIYREHGVHLVSVAIIRAEKRRSEMRRTLVGIIATGIGIVEGKTEPKSLVGICGKHDIDMILAIQFVSTVVVCHIRYR